MFRLNKTDVVDSEGRVVGIIVNDRFTQEVCDEMYQDGLSPRELEKISELMQKNGIQY